MDIRKLQKIVVNALESVKARDIENFDVRHLTTMFDRVIIASVESTRQAKALVNHMREDIRDSGARIYSVEGEESGEWVLIDLGDIVVHVLQPAMREHYKLEELWHQPKPRAPRAAARAATEAAAPGTAKSATNAAPGSARPSAARPAAKTPARARPKKAG